MVSRKNTCRDPHLQKPLGGSPGPCDPEADSSSKPFVFAALVEFEGANSAALECQPVDHQGWDPGRKTVGLNTAFPNELWLFIREKKSHKQVYKKYYCPKLVFKKGQQGKPKYTLKRIRMSRQWVYFVSIGLCALLILDGVKKFPNGGLGPDATASGKVSDE